MGSLRSLAFTKKNKLLDIWQRVNSTNVDGTTNQTTTDPSIEEEILLLQKNSEINKEAYLFHLLNQFITLFNNRVRSDNSTIIDYDSKIQNLLRYGLLKYLREWDNLPLATSVVNRINVSLKQALYHWWMEILNNLKSQSGNNGSLKLDISLLKTLMECLNRIMNLLIYIPSNSVQNMGNNGKDHSSNNNNYYHYYNDDELSNYCEHLLMTLHYITYQLNQNSKSKATDSYLKQFNNLLYDQLGLLNALAFVYFPDRFKYNLLVITLLTKGKFKIITDYDDPLLPWRGKNFKRLRNFPQRRNSILVTTDNNNNNIKCFKIIISYLQEEKTFQSFTFHYWRLMIILYQHRNFYMNENENLNNSYSHPLNMINSSEIIVYYTVHKGFIPDINRFKMLIKQINNKNTNTNNDSNNNSNHNIKFNKFINYFKSNKSITEFLETKFQMLIIWRQPLYELFSQFKDIRILYSILLYYDQKQLEELKRVSLYETQLTNLIFNKFLSVITIDQYKCNEFINWNSWSQIIVDCINTKSFENRINILKFLFNIWTYLPKENRYPILKQVIIMNNEMLTTFQHSHINILIIKLIIFKILPSKTDKDLLIPYIVSLEKVYSHLLMNQKKVMNSNNDDNTGHPDSLLLFDNNRKYVLTHKKIPTNDHYQNLYMVIDKEYNDDMIEKNKSENIDDDNMTDNDASADGTIKKQNNNNNHNNKYKVIPIFKNIVMPYNNNQQYNINKYNNRWENLTANNNDQLDYNSTKIGMESNNMLRFNLSVYKINNNIEKLDEELTLFSNMKDCNNNNETLLIHLHNFMKAFNLTMIEYYDYINLYNENEIRIEI